MIATVAVAVGTNNSQLSRFQYDSRPSFLQRPVSNKFFLVRAFTITFAYLPTKTGSLALKINNGRKVHQRPP